MPIKDSAKKYMKVTATKTEENRKTRGAYRAAIKNLLHAIDEKKEDDIKKYLLLSQKTLDKAVQKKVLKKNTAARKKSQLNKRVINAQK